MERIIKFDDTMVNRWLNFRVPLCLFREIESLSGKLVTFDHKRAENTLKAMHPTLPDDLHVNWVSHLPGMPAFEVVASSKQFPVTRDLDKIPFFEESEWLKKK